jgi:hypothetical protein
MGANEPPSDATRSFVLVLLLVSAGVVMHVTVLVLVFARFQVVTIAAAALGLLAAGTLASFLLTARSSTFLFLLTAAPSVFLLAATAALLLLTGAISLVLLLISSWTVATLLLGVRVLACSLLT